MATIKRSYSPDKHDGFWRESKSSTTINGITINPVNRLDYILTLQRVSKVKLLPK